MSTLKRLLALVVTLTLIGTLVPMQTYAQSTSSDAPALYAAGTTTETFRVLEEGTALHHQHSAEQPYQFKAPANGWYYLLIENKTTEPGYSFDASRYPRNYEVTDSTKMERLIWLEKDEIFKFYCKANQWVDPEKIDIAITMSKKADITGMSLVKEPTEPSMDAFIGTGMQIAIQHADNTRIICDTACDTGNGYSTNTLPVLSWNNDGYIDIASIDEQPFMDVDFSELAAGTHTATLQIPCSTTSSTEPDYYEIETTFEKIRNDVTSITITSSTKTYTARYSNLLEKVGLQAVYEDGTIENVPSHNNSVWQYFTNSSSRTNNIDTYLQQQYSGNFPNTDVTAEVTVEYKGATATYSITIKPHPYTGIHDVSPTKTVYYAGTGEQISIADIGKVTLNCWEGGTKTFNSLLAIPKNINSSYPTSLRYSNYGIKAGNSYVTNIDSYLQKTDSVRKPRVTATYLDYSDSYEIEIRDIPYERIEIIQNPSQTTYPSSYATGFHKLSLDGLIFRAFRSDGTYDTYTYGAEDGEGDGALPNWAQYFKSSAQDNKYYNAGTNTVPISFFNLNATFKIQVEDAPAEPAYTALSIHNGPTRSFYYVGENLSVNGQVLSWEGLTLELTDSNGITKLFEYGKDTENNTYGSWSKLNKYLKKFDTSQINWSVAGTYEVTVTCQEQTASFPIQIVDSPVTSFKIVKMPAKNVYVYSKDTMDLIGMSYKVTFADGSIYARTLTSSQEITLPYQGRKYHVSSRWWKTDSNGNPSPGEGYIRFSIFGAECGRTDTIHILEDPVTSIEVLKNPQKMFYLNTEVEADLYGARIKIVYSDNSIETIDVTEHTGSVTLDKYGEALQAVVKDGYPQTDPTEPSIDPSETYKGIELTYLNKRFRLPTTVKPKELTSIPIAINGQTEITLTEDQPYQILSFKPQKDVDYQLFCIDTEESDGMFDNELYIESYYGNTYLGNNSNRYPCNTTWSSPLLLPSYTLEHLEGDEKCYLAIYKQQTDDPGYETSGNDGRPVTFQCYLRPDSREELPGEITDVSFDPSGVRTNWYDFEFNESNMAAYSMFKGFTYEITYANGWKETKRISREISPPRVNGKDFEAEWENTKTPDPDLPWLSIPTGPQNTLIYTYDGKSCKVPVTISESPLKSIEIVNTPLENYNCYQYENLPLESLLEGLSVALNYKEPAGKREVVTFSKGNSRISVNGFPMEVLVRHKDSSYFLQVTYMDQTVEKKGDFKQNPVKEFTVGKLPQTTGFYPFESRTPDLYGMEFTISSQNGKTQRIEVREHTSAIQPSGELSEQVTAFVRNEKNNKGENVPCLYLRYLDYTQKIMEYSAYSIADAQDHVTDINIDETKYDILDTGQRYRIFRFQADTADTYKFSINSNVTYNVTLYNGQNDCLVKKTDSTSISKDISAGELLYLVVYATQPDSYGSISCTINKETVVKTPIPAADLTVEQPVAGETMPEIVLPSDACYKVKSQWYGTDENGIASFATAHRLRLELTPDAGYCFTSDSQVTLNRSSLTDKSLTSNGSLILYYTFPHTECKISLPKAEGYHFHIDADKQDRAPYKGSFAFQCLNGDNEPDKTLIVKANGNIIPLGDDGFYRLTDITENIDILVKSMSVTPGADESVLTLHDRSAEAYDIILGKQNYTLRDNPNGERTLPLLPSYVNGDLFFFGWYQNKDENLNGTAPRFTSMSKLTNKTYDLYAKWGNGIFNITSGTRNIRYQILSFDEQNKMTVQLKSLGKQQTKAKAARSLVLYNADSAEILTIPSTIDASQTSLEDDMGIDIDRCTVVAVADSAFAGETDIKNILLPDTIERIGANAFSNCSSLEEITLPDSVTEIGANAFDGCSSLQKVVIPSAVTKLPEGAFRGCQSLTVVLPDTIQEIAPDAFEDTSNITIICGSGLADSGLIENQPETDITVQTVDISLSCSNKFFTYKEAETVTASIQIDGEPVSNRTFTWKITDPEAYTCTENGDSLLIMPNRVTTEEEAIFLTVVDAASARTATIPLHTQPADLSRKDTNGKDLYVVEVEKDLVYTGKEIRPSVTVKKAGKNSPNLDASEYEVSYSDNTNAGTGKVTVTGKSNYIGSISKTFAIAKGTQTITASDLVRSTKNFIVPLGVKCNGNGKLSFTSSDEHVATVNDNGIATIRGAGITKISIQAAETANYKASFATITLTVNDAKDNTSTEDSKLKVPRIFYTKVYGNKPFSLKATAKTAVTYKSSNQKVATVSKTGKVTLRKCGKSIITVKTKDKKIKVTVCVLPKKASFKTTSKKSGQLKVSWKRQAEASGYMVEYSTDKTFKNKVTRKYISKNKTTSVTLKKLSKGRRYYVRVRAYTIIDKKKRYGALSRTAAQKTKK